MEELTGQYLENTMEGKMLGLWKRVRQLRLGDLPHDRFDLTVSQMEQIVFVGTHPGCHLQDIAEGLELTSPTVSVGIRRLEEIGLIERRPDPKDKRAACFYLTEVSAKALQRMTQVGMNRMQRFLSHLEPDEQEQLYLLLNKAVTGVEQSIQDNTNLESN